MKLKQQTSLDVDEALSFKWKSAISVENYKNQEHLCLDNACHVCHGASPIACLEAGILVLLSRALWPQVFMVFQALPKAFHILVI